MSKLTEWTEEAVMTDGFGSMLRLFPTGQKDKRVYAVYENDFVGVYGSPLDALRGTNKLGVISRLEWDEHDRAGEHGACSLCDDKHMVTQTLTDWRITLTEIIEEQYKVKEA
jgi:hypothetical protein